MCSEPVEARSEGLVEIDYEVIFRCTEGCGSWDRFREMFSTRYVPRDEKERLAREFLELKQDLESVSEITGMFIERAMFCPEFASGQAQMSRYLSMLKRDIRQFVSAWRCETLLELQEAARRRELEIELQLRELRQAPV